jgi:hypothetical protein
MTTSLLDNYRFLARYNRWMTQRNVPNWADLKQSCDALNVATEQ